MKKILVFTLCLALLAALAACGAKEEKNTAVFQAVVTQIENGAMLVSPADRAWERNSSDCISLSLEHLESSPEPEVGDTVEISYDGEICETYPATLGQVFSIRVVE